MTNHSKYNQGCQPSKTPSCHTKILLTKLDFKAEYRWLHMAPKTAIQSAVVFDDFALVELRLPFGGAPCLSH